MHVVLNTNHTTTINNAEPDPDPDPDPDECNHGADTWWRWLVYERRRRRHVWPDWLWHCVQWWTTQHPGNVVHKAHRSAFGCVSPRTPPYRGTRLLHPGNVVHKAHRSAFGCVSPRTPPHSVTSENYTAFNRIPSHPIAPNILSSILSFQHTCNSFIPFFSFLQHNNWEKLTTIFNSTIINSWGIFDELKHGLLSVQILIGELPGNYRGTTGELRSPHPSFTKQSGHMSQHNGSPLHTIAHHRTPSHTTFIHPSSHFILIANHSLSFFHSYNTTNERNSP